MIAGFPVSYMCLNWFFKRKGSCGLSNELCSSLYDFVYRLEVVVVDDLQHEAPAAAFDPGVQALDAKDGPPHHCTNIGMYVQF